MGFQAMLVTLLFVIVCLSKCVPSLFPRLFRCLNLVESLHHSIPVFFILQSTQSTEYSQQNVGTQYIFEFSTWLINYSHY